MTKRMRHWIPSTMEQKCLSHLDRPGSWKLLRVPDEPEPIDRIGWRHVRRIFAYNLTLFGILVTVLLAAMSFGSGENRQDFIEDLPYGVSLAACIALAMAAYVANLYRIAWNHRAMSLVGGDRAS